MYTLTNMFHLGIAWREGSYIFNSGKSDNDAVPHEHTTMVEGERNPGIMKKKRKRRSRERNSTSKKGEKLGR